MERKYVGKISELPEAEGMYVPNSSKKVVFSPDNFWPDYVMRCFTIGPNEGSKTPHEHEWPHWVVIFDGEGVFAIDGTEYPVKRGDYVFVPGNIPHYNYNTSSENPFCFLCIVPPEGDVNPMANSCCG